MMQASDEVPPTIETCNSLDSVEMYDIELDRIPESKASSPGPPSLAATSSMTSGSSCAGSTLSTPPRPMANNHVRHEQRSASLLHGMTPPPTITTTGNITASSYGQRRQLVPPPSYNLISPAQSLEKSAWTESQYTTSTASVSGTGSTCSFESRSHEQQSSEKKDDRGVYRFQVQSVQSSSVLEEFDSSCTPLAPINEAIEAMSPTVNTASLGTIQSIEPRSKEQEREQSEKKDDRGVYKFRVRVDPAQFAKTSWWNW